MSPASLSVGLTPLSTSSSMQRADKVPAGQREALVRLRGKIAIANAKLAYQTYKRQFAGARWEKLRARGARVQRLLWASTGVKDPAYRDVLYVEQLIAPRYGQHPSACNAWMHSAITGRWATPWKQTSTRPNNRWRRSSRSGISIDQVTDKLVIDGVDLFSEAFDQLLGAVAHKRIDNLGPHAQ